jgi:pimeloyl-ACP methyl ester carboxylesterase
VQRVETDLLSIAFESGGSASAPVVLLLHGWPDDASTWRSISRRLEEAGFRWIAPWLRGFGQTRFKATATFRDGGAEALAQDALDLMRNLGVDRFSVVGHDWGARTAYTLAALVPQQLNTITALSLGYSPRGSFPVPPFRQSRAWWYQWFMSVDRGADAVRDDPKGFARLQWETWSPPGWFSEEDFSEVARSFENVDWLPITLNSYRARWREEPHDPRYDNLRRRVGSVENLSVATLMIQGLADGTVLPDSTEGKERWFTNG